MVVEVVHPDIVQVIAAIDRLGIECSPVTVEDDNAEYSAMLFRIGGVPVRFRVGKLTPTKVGSFVAVWRRASDGSTEPFAAEDSTAMLVVVAREGAQFGAFVFPKSALVEHGVTSVDGVGGKRGFRVYPPWSATANPQAKRTQKWQCAYFFEISDGSALEPALAQQLLNTD